MTDIPIVKSIITSCSDPVFIVTPKKKLSDEEMVKVYIAIESLLERISSKTNHDFDIVIDSSAILGDYKDLFDLAECQKDEAEDELWRS